MNVSNNIIAKTYRFVEYSFQGAADQKILILYERERRDKRPMASEKDP